MKTKLDLTPTYPENRNLRMYNMFPYRRYASGGIGIENMCSYIPEVAAMGYNAIWINPLQATGSKQQLHPDKTKMVSGSLYAMADDIEFNPLLFPDSDLTNSQEQLKQWTKEVRSHGMFPLFDLVLNHIGIEEKGYSPLQLKLMQAEKRTGLTLLLSEKNERWPDIQGIDYYKDGVKKRGITATPKDLDQAKIDVVFEVLWEPFITRYIKEFGFMGVRVDALSHIPVAIQQRAYKLVQDLVKESYGTEAIVVGEFMVQDEASFQCLSACGLTHCLNPNSFFWGSNLEGGYKNSSDESSFYKLNEQILSSLALTAKPLTNFSNLIVLHDKLDKSGRLQKNTIYIFMQEDNYYLALNDNETDICFNKTAIHSIDIVDCSLLPLLIEHKNLSSESNQAGIVFGKQQAELNKKIKVSGISQESKDAFQASKKEFISNQDELKKNQSLVVANMRKILNNTELGKGSFATGLSATKPGGAVGVVGNHDVGTLKAKVMLDIAYNRALSNTMDNMSLKQGLLNTYKECKQTVIKGAKNTNDLINQLQSRFLLNEIEIKQLELDINIRMREKIFIQAMMSTGGWYSIAGDEWSVCHKPEVFSEFAKGNSLGSSFQELYESEHPQNDLRAFISGINKILTHLPPRSSQDKTIMDCVLLENDLFGKKPANFLFIVLHYNASTNEYYLIAHCDMIISQALLNEKIAHLIATIPSCEIYLLDKNGLINSFKYPTFNPAKQFDEPFSSEESYSQDRFFKISIEDNSAKAGKASSLSQKL